MACPASLALAKLAVEMALRAAGFLYRTLGEAVPGSLGSAGGCWSGMLVAHATRGGDAIASPSAHCLDSDAFSGHEPFWRRHQQCQKRGMARGRGAASKPSTSEDLKPDRGRGGTVKVVLLEVGAAGVHG